MKKQFLIPLIAVCALLAGLFTFRHIQISSEVNELCAVNEDLDPQDHEGELWAECAADIALTNGDAKYCRAGGVFNPFTELCMSIFAEEANQESFCKTISKPKQRNQCTTRFKS